MIQAFERNACKPWVCGSRGILLISSMARTSVMLAGYSPMLYAFAFLVVPSFLSMIQDTHVRLEAVRSLVSLYEKSDYIGTLQQFTDRFKGRLVQIATSDLELSVRVAAIQVLVAIDSHSLLEDEQRDELCLLVYDEEPRVRKAVAGFVRGVWEEAVQDRMVGRVSGSDKAKDAERVGIKCLATLLVKWGRRTVKGLGSMQDLVSDSDTEESPVEDTKNKDIARLVSAHHKGRIALAVDALWDEVEAIGDWEMLLEHLLLDHSASLDDDVNGVGPSPVAARRRQQAAAKKKATEEDVVDEAWRLTDPEEAALLEVFVATLKKTRDEATGLKKVGLMKFPFNCILMTFAGRRLYCFRHDSRTH
jgi:cohesin complex subunit SA-1/2